MLGIEVSEIHRYPSRPDGFEEPLFPTIAARRAVMEHFLEAPWLERASELKARTGGAAHTLKEPVEIGSHGGRPYVARPQGRRCSWRRRAVVEVLGRWREVREWWGEDGQTDRAVFRLLLSGGAVVDVARVRSGNWLLVEVVD